MPRFILLEVLDYSCDLLSFGPECVGGDHCVDDRFGCNLETMACTQRAFACTSIPDGLEPVARYAFQADIGKRYGQSDRDLKIDSLIDLVHRNGLVHA